MKTDTLRKRTRRSNSKFYAKSREIPKINDRKLNKDLKQLSHRVMRKSLKTDLKNEVYDVVNFKED